jgi:hypothetical protein
MRGSVYVVSNPAMPGLLKVGYTTRAVDQRLAELASTGVPGKFRLEFFCEIAPAATLERQVHSALRKFHHNKEFFKCSLNEAVRAVKTELLSGAFVVYDMGGRANGAFLTPSEQQQIQRQAAALAAQRQEQLERQRAAAQLESRFLSVSSAADAALKKYCSQGKNEGLKSIAMLGLALTAPLHLGAGLLVFDKISPCGFDDGRATAKRLTANERATISQLYLVIAELRSLNAWRPVAERFYSTEQFLVSRGSTGCDVSDLLQGVFLGLGHIRPS